MDAIIEARGLTKVYRRGAERIYALQDVDFDIDEGEFVSIIGPSGSGKTALLNILGCLDTPSGGCLQLCGVKTTGLKESRLVRLRRDNIGFVFQQFYLLPTLTARENIELPLLFRKVRSSRGRIDEVLDMVGLADRGDHLPGQLSGGEMQRVAIGRALINDPRIILADEPTGNLDSSTSQMIFQLFHSLNRQGLTLVIVTHNLELAKRAQKMYTLQDGRIAGREERMLKHYIEEKASLSEKPVGPEGRSNGALGTDGKADIMRGLWGSSVNFKEQHGSMWVY